MKIYAHRGSSGENPEMTMTAYLAAISDGADGFECDVRLTKDKQIACIHDGDTFRISGTTLKVSGVDLSVLKKSAPVITLLELVDLAIKNKKDILVETKHPVRTGGAIEREVCALLDSKAEEIEKSGIEIICMSFSWFAVRRFSKVLKSCTVSKYYWQVLFSRTQIVAINIDLVKKYPKLVKRLKRRGKRVLVWTVNSPDQIALCHEAGIDGLITNFPKRARING
jgi:glycerophosphoryl diester phosphodiesterase